MISRIFFWIFVLKIVTALPAGVHLGKDGSVGASFGGYSASAGLGGILGGSGPRGGLHAQAGTPDGHFASAGLGGTVSDGAGPQGNLYSGAGKVQPVVVAQPVAVPVAGEANSQASASSSASSHQGGAGGVGGVAYAPVASKPGSFFDDIFNIPISTLGAVNQYLNNRNRGVVYTKAVPSSLSNSNAQSSSSASSSASASASASASTGGSSGIDNNIYHGYHTKPTNYNDIFNIPISVLGAVNRFLNG